MAAAWRTDDRDELHFERFVHLADADDDQALTAWGGFWFRPEDDGRSWRTVDDEQLHHGNDDDQIATLLPLYREGGVRVVLAGHEHNFQHAEVDGMHHLICGAGGKLRAGRPDATAAAGTRSWAAQPHVLLGEIDRERISLLPVADLDDDGRPVPIDIEVVEGRSDELPIVTHRGPTSQRPGGRGDDAPGNRGGCSG